MNRRSVFKTTILLFALSAIPFAASAENIRNFVSPSADVVLYFNSRRAEKTMDPVLLQQIRKDQAEKLSAKNPSWTMKDRDVEAVLNLFVRQVSPFQARMEGVARISGNLKNDIENILKEGKARNWPAPQVSREGQYSRYFYSFPAEGKRPSVNLMFVQTGENVIRFHASFGSAVRTPPETLRPYDSNDPVQQTLRKDTFFALILRTDGFSKTADPDDPTSAMLKTWTSTVRSAVITGKVQGKKLILTADIQTVSEEIAAQYSELLGNLIRSKIQTMKDSALTDMPVVRAGNEHLFITVELDIQELWKRVIAQAEKAGETPDNDEEL